jgi:gluconate:H+ symporter, GntP family
MHGSTGGGWKRNAPALPRQLPTQPTSGFIPPHPGPLAAIANLHADVGITLALGLVIAIPTIAIAGPLFAPLAAKWVPIGARGAANDLVSAGFGGGTPSGGGTGDDGGAASVEGGSRDPQAQRSPTFNWTLITVLSPVVLMLVRAGSDVWMSKNAAIYPFLQFMGEPVVALLIAVLLASVTFGTAVGFSRTTITTKFSQSLMPIASATFIVGPAVDSSRCWWMAAPVLPSARSPWPPVFRHCCSAGWLPC